MLILIIFVFKKERFYPKVILKENKEKVTRYSTDDLEISSDSSDREKIKTNYYNNVFLREQFW